MLKLLKSFWRGFVGGPNFTCCIMHSFMLNDKQLTITLPDSNVVAAPSTLDVNFPHTSTSWFNQHVEESEFQHAYVHMMTELWMYVPTIAIGTSSEYGMLTCELRIKQTHKINVLDKQALAHFAIQEYADYHNGPDGANTKINQRVTEQSSKMARPLEPDELEKEIAEYIELHGYQALPLAKTKKISQLEWVFYQEIKNNHRSRSDYYCLPLSETSFLEVKFRHRVDRSNKHKKWKKHAMAAQERIMASISLNDLPIEHDSLIEHQAISK